MNDVEELNFREHLEMSGNYIVNRFRHYASIEGLDDLIAKLFELWKEYLPDSYEMDTERADINMEYEQLKADLYGEELLRL